MSREFPERKGGVSQSSNTSLRLQRSILKITAAFRGHDPGYDARLARLAQKVRDGELDDQFAELLEHQAEQVLKLAGRRISASAEPGAASTVRIPGAVYDEIGALITALVAALGLSNRTREALQRRLNGAAQRPDSGFSALAALMSQIREAALECDPRPTGGADTQALSAASAAAAPATGASTDAQTALESQRRLATRLVEHIPMSAARRDDIANFRARVADASSGEEIEAALVGFADMLVEMKESAQEELKELGAFLKRLTDYLTDVDGEMTRSSAAHAASRADSEALNASIGSAVQDIHADFQSAASPEEVRAAVEQHLARINSSLGDFLGEQTHRHTASEQSLAALQARVRDLEKETGTLRENLAAQEQQAIIDPLTRVANRLGMQRILKAEMERARALDAPLSIAVIDIDHFKRINDTFGHTAGDKVLMAVAQQINTAIRRSDKLSRFGGEEFLILLPETDLRSAFLAIDKVRDLIANCQFEYKHQDVPVTVSAGVAQFAMHEPFEQVFERADAALYRAKQEGRNRCIAAD